jgi:hypothetical protein
VYLAFTEAKGAFPLSVRLIDADETQPPLFERTEVVQFSNPRTVVELAFFEVDVHFPSPGEYLLQLLRNDVQFFERRLLLFRASPNGSHP